MTDRHVFTRLELYSKLVSSAEYNYFYILKNGLA